MVEGESHTRRWMIENQFIDGSLFTAQGEKKNFLFCAPTKTQEKKKKNVWVEDRKVFGGFPELRHLALGLLQQGKALMSFRWKHKHN